MSGILRAEVYKENSLDEPHYSYIGKVARLRRRRRSIGESVLLIDMT